MVASSSPAEYGCPDRHKWCHGVHVQNEEGQTGMLLEERLCGARQGHTAKNS